MFARAQKDLCPKADPEMTIVRHGMAHESGTLCELATPLSLVKGNNRQADETGPTLRLVA